MTSQTHKVATTDALETLGTYPIPDNSGRDAIHLAVEPAIAGLRLRPGERVKIEEGFAVSAGHDATGIVDPFLDGLVQSGQRFWFVVLPRTITSLRHVWSHPEFPEAATYHADADDHYVSPDQDASKRWIEQFCDRVGERYEYVMEGAAAWVSHGDWTYGEDYSGALEGERVPDEFWQHYQVVTGKNVPPDKQRSFFTCSC
jgi:hypothetical protein